MLRLSADIIMEEQRPIPPVLADVLKAEAARVQRNTERIVRRFLNRWGYDIFDEDKAALASSPTKPLILVVDLSVDVCELHKMGLEKAGYLVATTQSGRVMLAKNQVLRPCLIVTGINVLHFYPPAYAWMIANLERADAVPMLFVTAASGWRIPREVPKSPKARTISKPTDFKELLRNVEDMLEA